MRLHFSSASGFVKSVLLHTGARTTSKCGSGRINALSSSKVRGTGPQQVSCSNTRMVLNCPRSISFRPTIGRERRGSVEGCSRDSFNKSVKLPVASKSTVPTSSQVTRAAFLHTRGRFHLTSACPRNDESSTVSHGCFCDLFKWPADGRLPLLAKTGRGGQRFEMNV